MESGRPLIGAADIEDGNIEADHNEIKVNLTRSVSNTLAGKDKVEELDAEENVSD